MNYTPNSKAAALAARIREARENVSAIREYWVELFGEPAPSDSQIHRWLLMYGFDTVVEAFLHLAKWVGKQSQKLELIRTQRQPTKEEIQQFTKTLLDMIRYASGIMRNIHDGTDDERVGKETAHEPRA